MEVPEDLAYTKEHEWLKRDGTVATIGITDYAQKELGDVVYVELPPEGQEVKYMEPFGVVESVKSVSDLYCPVSGRVVETNSELPGHPEWINQQPYGKGWMIKVEMEDPSEIDSHMSAAQYREFVEKGEEE